MEVSLIYNEFQDNQGYIKKPCFNKNKQTKQNKQKQRIGNQKVGSTGKAKTGKLKLSSIPLIHMVEAEPIPASHPLSTHTQLIFKKKG